MRIIKMFCGVIFMLLATPLYAQTFEEYKRQQEEGIKAISAEFDEYQKKRQQEYREYRDKINAEYAEFIRKSWAKYDSEPAIPVPDSPEPPSPVVRPDIQIEQIKKPLPLSDLVPMPTPKPLVRPDIPHIPVSARNDFEFEYYGTPCMVPFDKDLNFTLTDISENSIANTWNRLTNDKSQELIVACIDLCDELELCDWGYVCLIKEMTKKFYGERKKNEAVLMQMYVLTQSGYKVRIAKSNGNLILLLPSSNEIWQYSYIPMGNYKYYIIDGTKYDSYYVFDHEFPNEQLFSLSMNAVPLLETSDSEFKTFTSKRYPEANVSISTNENLVNFYKDYPLSNDWDIYARTSLSDEVKAQLYPGLEAILNGKRELESAQVLINFVQTAFEYKTDGNQFGFEKPFFADELFYYPYCDCEDRSILFSILIHDLLGLDVVMINYPGHMATAVHFNEEVSGSYFEINNEIYTICDPTYINAPVGEEMPQFTEVPAKIIEIW